MCNLSSLPNNILYIVKKTNEICTFASYTSYQRQVANVLTHYRDNKSISSSHFTDELNTSGTATHFAQLFAQKLTKLTKITDANPGSETEVRAKVSNLQVKVGSIRG